MNGVVLIALIIIVYCVVNFACKVIEIAAQDMARERGERRMLEWRSMQQRIAKRGEFKAGRDW